MTSAQARLPKAPELSPALRKVIQQTVRPEYIQAITRVLIYKSLLGELAAIRELHAWGQDTVNVDLNPGVQAVPIRINLGQCGDRQDSRSNEPSAEIGFVESKFSPPQSCEPSGAAGA
jgi:hypothetical protein